MKANRLPEKFDDQLLVRPTPVGLKGEKPTESFLSWLTRLSWANGFKNVHSLLLVEGLARDFFSDVSSRDRRIRLLHLGGQDKHAFESFSLENILAVVGWKREPTRTTKWLLRDRETADSLPHQVCVQCLAGERTAYWPRDGRASFVTQCHIHNVLLLDCCPACNGRLGLSTHRTTPLRRCGLCEFDLTGAHTPKLGKARLVPAHWYAFTERTPHPCGIGWITKPTMWRGFDTILSFVCSPPMARALLRAPIARSHHSLFEEIYARESAAFNVHRTELRHQMLVFARWLLESWPQRILELCDQAQLRRPLDAFAKDASTRNWALEPFRFTRDALPLEERYDGTFAEAP